MGKIGLSVTNAIYDANIGIYTHEVSAEELCHLDLSPEEVERAVLRKTLTL